MPDTIQIPLKPGRYPAETASANASRLRFIFEQLLPMNPRRILDVGCGTGSQLTGFVAALFPDADVLGVDEDALSIQFARKLFTDRPNLKFRATLPRESGFDVIILSEVLEHVDNPGQFLAEIGDRLRNDGLIIVTIPNGYGCSEIMSSIETIYQITGLRSMVNRLLNKKYSALAPECEDSLATSPHIHFFSFNDIQTIFQNSGYAITAYQGRMFLHNFIISRILNLKEAWCRVNARLGRRLHPFLVSGWMFAIQKGPEPLTTTELPPAGLYGKLKRRLNYKRFGQKEKNTS